MSAEDKITPALLREFLSYDAETGRIVFLPRDRQYFLLDRACTQFNKRWVGREALNTPSPTGYLRGSISLFGVIPVTAHRAAWAIYYGAWPLGMIDHINGVRDDNRIVNLRVVSPQDNSKNRGIPKNCASGFVGIAFQPWNNVWRARAYRNGRTISLGTFPKIEDALSARKRALAGMNYHSNHGEHRQNYPQNKNRRNTGAEQ